MVYSCAQVSSRPWFSAHRSMITRHLMNLETSVNAAAEASHWQDKVQEKMKDTISSRQHGHTNSNEHETRLFQWHFPSDLWLNKNLQAIRSSSTSPRLTLGKKNKDILQKATKNSVQSKVGSEETASKISDHFSSKPFSIASGHEKNFKDPRSRSVENLGEILDNLPLKRSTDEKRIQKKNRAEELHYRPVNLDQGSDLASAMSVRDCGKADE
ncbi:hypothetical protein DdX_15114 [Ditylenchus destructor]|uniref:Uncharacterized protein n=1 Tax=Ditylenchus destructor TaxID=166010 RepID=A0AAD4MPZ9_9BILA|nr:hypothetical protein DdX_15114 [Ditylenchus destructor]